MPSLPRIRLRLAFRLRTLLVLVALIAVGLGIHLDRRRREEIRQSLEHPILAAAERGDVAQVRALLDRGADVDSVTDGRFPWTPLMNAAFRGHADVARLLLERGADPDHQDLDCIRPITLAAAGGHWEIVLLLIKSGAQTETTDYASKSALDYAREQGPPVMVQFLEALGKEAGSR